MCVSQGVAAHWEHGTYTHIYTHIQLTQRVTPMDAGLIVFDAFVAAHTHTHHARAHTHTHTHTYTHTHTQIVMDGFVAATWAQRTARAQEMTSGLPLPGPKP